MSDLVGKTLNKSFLISSEKVRAFAEVSGDFNPIHIDPKYAATTVFKRPIAHGMYAGSLISCILANDLPGPGTIYLSQTLMFKRPIYIEEEVTFTVTVTKEIKPKIYELTTSCTDKEGTLLLDGVAVVKYDGKI